jgi:hypothetical protein
MRRWERVLLYLNTLVSSCVLVVAGFAMIHSRVEQRVRAAYTNGIAATAKPLAPVRGDPVPGDTRPSERDSESVAETASIERYDKLRERALQEEIWRRQVELEQLRAAHEGVVNQLLAPYAKFPAQAGTPIPGDISSNGRDSESVSETAGTPAPSTSPAPPRSRVPTAPGRAAGTPGVIPPTPSQ